MERLLHGLAQGLGAEEFEVHIVVLEYFGRFAEGLENRVTLHRLPPMSRLSLLYPRSLAKTVRHIAPDIVHSHSGVWLKAARAGRLAGARAVVHTEHGRPTPIPLGDRLIDGWASRSTDIVIAVSEALAEVLRGHVVRDPTEVRVIINGVDTAHFQPASDPAPARRALGIPEEAAVIGSVGRLEPVKNYRLALRALARLGDRLPDGRIPWLVLAGDGRDRPALEAEAVALGVRSRVIFLGWQPDAARVYHALDLFTISSISEGTSISLLEAMSSAVCPVVTAVGGNAEVLGPDLQDLLVPSEDDAALATAWRRQLADPAGCAAIGRSARDRVQEWFSLDRVVRQHAALYREILERRGAVTVPATGDRS